MNQKIIDYITLFDLIAITSGTIRMMSADNNTEFFIGLGLILIVWTTEIITKKYF